LESASSIAARPFRAPLVPLIPILGILTCLLLMFSLPAENWLRLGGWLVIGFVIYFGYGRRRSVMARYLNQEITVHGVSPGGSIVADTEARGETGLNRDIKAKVSDKL
jgi:4-amino-4-deoxy-L-arabinose transferase-like glycosyltransferase